MAFMPVVQNDKKRQKKKTSPDRTLVGHFLFVPYDKIFGILMNSRQRKLLFIINNRERERERAM
jgi:hypothetical protein